MSKFKDERILTHLEGEDLLHTRELHKTSSRFFSRNFADQKGMAQYIQLMKGKNFQPIIFYPIILSLRNEGERKFPREAKATRSVLQEMLKGLLQAERKAAN